MPRRLHRSRSERIIGGVCGGLGQYFNIDPVLVRVIAVLLIFASGIGILAYIILWIIVPAEGSTAIRQEQIVKENIKDAADAAAVVGEQIRDTFRGEREAGPGENEAAEPPRGAKDRGRYIAGIALVVVGLFILLSNLNLFWWLTWGRLWPLALIIIGLAIIAGRARRSGRE